MTTMLTTIAEDAANQDYPAATLYLIATPIGNLADITIRALECLRRMDAIAAEDTRVARRLLNHFAIDKPCFAAHHHNERAVASEIVVRLKAGQRIGFISDAGTPAISDPGTLIADAAHEAGIRVIPIPGASAAVCALSASGLGGGAFQFVGFLPAKRGQAEAALRALTSIQVPLIFYEAPHRILETLELMGEVFGGERRIALARELTKLFESIHRTTLAEIAVWVRADANRVRGEFVIVLEGAPDEADPLKRALPVLEQLMASLPLSEAVSLTASILNVAHKPLYARALALKRAAGESEVSP